MPELGPYGSVRGARGNSRPYRDHDSDIVKVTRLTHMRLRQRMDSPCYPPLNLPVSAKKSGTLRWPRRGSNGGWLPYWPAM